jgi:hypothetical protein
MGVVAGVDEAEQTPQAAAQTQQGSEQAGQQAPESEPVAEQAPGFGERGRMRRRARFLRKARELAYRDLGGLVFDLHRFGQRNDQLVLAKLATLRQIDTEVRELEGVLHDRRPITVLREVGIAACPRCAAIHGSDDRFCPGCGLAFDTNADRPISTASVVPQASAQQAQAPQVHGQPALTTQAHPPQEHAPLTPATQTHAPLPTEPPVNAASSKSDASEREQEDEPTQVLRPPDGGAGA